MTGQQDPLRKCPRGATGLLATVEEEGSMVSHLQARMLAPPGNLATILPLDLKHDLHGLSQWFPLMCL